MAKQATLKQAPTLELEELSGFPACGIDEAGRGPLAGPVVAACVLIPQEMHDIDFLAEINDSKKVAPKKREALFTLIRENFHYGIAQARPEEIDTLNIHHATLLAMRRAYDKMTADNRIKPRSALIDGKFCPDLACSTQAVTKGDSKSLSIAAASILAKVTRDRIMTELHEEFPHYGWERNAGYGTPQHLEGIKIHGITPHHRRSFAPIKDYKA